jgi:hypothetical protein
MIAVRIDLFPDCVNSTLSAAEAGVAHPIVKDAWSCQLA